MASEADSVRRSRGLGDNDASDGDSGDGAVMPTPGGASRPVDVRLVPAAGVLVSDVSMVMAEDALTGVRALVPVLLTADRGVTMDNRLLFAVMTALGLVTTSPDVVVSTLICI